jgi:hypothetical protein
VATGQVLIEITEIGPQILQMGLVVEELETVQNEWKITQDNGGQRREAEEKEKYQYLRSEFHEPATAPQDYQVSFGPAKAVGYLSTSSLSQ